MTVVDDRWDQCLDESENYNGFADTDGCPDVIGISNSQISSVIDSDDDAIPDDIWIYALHYLKDTMVILILTVALIECIC